MPPPADSTLTHWVLQVDGAEVPELMEAVRSIEVDQNLFLPDMCIVVLNEGSKWSDHPRISLGHNIRALAPTAAGPNAPTVESFHGDVVALDGDFGESGHTSLTIRAYDHSHRLQNGSRIRSWQSISDSDIAKRIASEYGLTVDADATNTVYEHIIQDNVSDFSFLQERARASGRIMTIEGTKLLFKRYDHFASAAIELDLGKNLLAFYPRMSASGQVGSVEAHGWDVKAKRKILGRSQAGDSMAERSEFGKRGIDLFRSSAGTSAPALHITDAAVEDQGHADTQAATRLADFWARDFRAEGTALGDPRIRAGARVTIQNQGRFNGEYIVTGARHLYEGGHYLVRFSITGFGAETTADLVSRTTNAMSSTITGRMNAGIVIGVVTNNEDPDNLGRVKLKFPWLDDEIESAWARWVAPMAGKDRGFFCLPEVNDEVAVAFEHGDFNRPYVLGALWNGQDTPPEQSGVAVKSGDVVHRIFKTRAGHIIRLDDTSGSEKIEILDKTGNNTIVIECASNKITIASAGEISLNATQKISMSAPSIEISATQGFTVDAAQVQISGSATTTIKGGVVQIN